LTQKPCLRQFAESLAAFLRPGFQLLDFGVVGLGHINLDIHSGFRGSARAIAGGLRSTGDKRQRRRARGVTSTFGYPGHRPSSQENATFTIYVFHDPKYKKPWVLATSLKLRAESVHQIYSDRWPVEQMPLSTKQMVFELVETCLAHIASL
jgi:hypothetical protein